MPKQKKIFKPLATGWLPKKPDYRDASWDKIFGAVAEIPPDFFSRPIPDYIPYQGQILCCVWATLAKLQEYNSSLESHQVQLSFRMGYANTPGDTGGRDYGNCAAYLKNTGIPESSFCPNDVAVGPNNFLDVSQYVTPDEQVNDDIFRIKNYSFINTNLDSLKSACYRQPIAIAIPGNNVDWTKNIDEIVTYSSRSDWQHSVIMWDWTDTYIGILNWWGDRYRKLSLSYPILSGMSLEDLPDDWQAINMDYVILPNGEQFLLYKVLKLAFSISDEQELAGLKTQGLNVEPKSITTIPMGYVVYPLINRNRVKELFNL